MRSLDTLGPAVLSDAEWLQGQVLTLSDWVAVRIDKQMV